MSARIVSVIRNSLVAALLFVAAAPAYAQGQDTATASITDTAGLMVGVMRPGDELNLQVFRDKELTGKYLIDSRGYVQIPGLGVIRVAGLSPAEATDRLRQQLIRRGTANPELAVYPLIRVSVLGEVVKPGLYSVDPGTSIIQLVTLVGGPTPNADLTHTSVIREGKTVPIDLRSALSGSASGRVVLYSNDVLVVPRKSTFFSRENLSFVFTGLSLVVAILNLALAARR